MLNNYPKWRDEFVLSREQRGLGRYAELVSDVRRGVLVPITRGAFRRAESIERDPVRHADDAFLARIRAGDGLAAGGRELALLPCLNESPEWIEALASLAGFGDPAQRPPS